MNRLARALEERIKHRQARVGIAGLGYVGLPLAVEFGRAGFTVLGIDVDSARVASLTEGRSHVEDVPATAVEPLVREGRLLLQDHYRGSGQCDVIVICVPTPLRKTKDPDISYIVAAVDAIAAEAREGQLIILESTTYPGTTEEVVRPRLEAGNLKAGRDFFLAFSPERVDPGNQRYTTGNTPKVVGGTSRACCHVAALLYRQVIEKVHEVSSTQTAEMVKLLENTFRAVNIAMVNEIALMCEKLNLDAWEVIEGAATKPFGFMPFYPGPGIGGHCIPLDPHYLSWKLRTLNYSARFIELAAEINGGMPHVVARRIAEMLNERRRSVKGSRILILGVAYKRDTSDVRESPGLDLIRLLAADGANVSYHDPFVPTLRVDGEKPKRSAQLSPAALARADLVVIVTDHSVFDYAEVVRHSRAILDTRNATRAVRVGRGKIRKL